jgi:hypothetical protein
LLTGCSLDAGIGGALPELDWRGEGDSRFGLIDRESPAVAGDVPVELVELLEPAELAAGAVVDGVAVVAGLEEYIRLADVNADAVAPGLGPGLIGLPVARDADQVEGNADIFPVPPALARREVAVDTATNLVAFGPDGDDFGDQQVAVLLDGDVAIVAKDLLLGVGSRRQEQRRQEKEELRDARHGGHAGRAKSILGAL